MALLAQTPPILELPVVPEVEEPFDPEKMLYVAQNPEPLLLRRPYRRTLERALNRRRSHYPRTGPDMLLYDPAPPTLFEVDGGSAASEDSPKVS